MSIMSVIIVSGIITLVALYWNQRTAKEIKKVKTEFREEVVKVEDVGKKAGWSNRSGMQILCTIPRPGKPGWSNQVTNDEDDGTVEMRDGAIYINGKFSIGFIKF